jgi:hypothetical protein
LLSETLSIQRGETLVLHVVEEGIDDGSVRVILRGDEGSEESESGNEETCVYDGSACERRWRPVVKLDMKR